MLCTSHPSDWKHHPLPPSKIWTIEKMKNRKECIDRREIREAREILAIVNWK
jgi:hypothetical protein